MKIGFIGLGRMGSSMVKRLCRAEHHVVVYDHHKEKREKAESEGAVGVASLQDLIQKLDPPRNVWVMVPHGEPTQKTISELISVMSKDDLIVDGGNSHFEKSIQHAKQCKDKEVYFLDVGVSGGVWGLEVGYNLMIGGQKEAFERMEPVFKSLAPQKGYAHVGGSGSGHFVKMIHNALEYAMLQSLGEAFECLQRSQFDVDLKQVADLWEHGSVVRCWLLELLAKAFSEQGNNLEKIGDYIEDSDTGRWTTEFAVKNAIPIPTMTQSLYERFASREEKNFAAQVVAVLRNQFGGHAIKKG